MPAVVNKLIQIGVIKYRCPICCNEVSHIERKGEDEYVFSCDANRTVRTERAVFEMFSEFCR